MKLDCHNHIGYRIGAHFSAEEIIEWMDKAEVDMAVVFPQCESPIDNEYVADSAEKYPDRLVGFAQLVPWDYDAPQELSRLTTQRGLRGLKLNPTRHGYALDRIQILDPLFEIAASRGIPIISHGKDDLFSMPGKFKTMADRHPRVTLIMAHMGVDRAFNAACRVANQCPNLYLDTAGVAPKYVKKALDAVGPEKIVMGTDAPWGRFELSIEAVKRSTSDKAAQKQIMGGNMKQILGM